MKYQNICLIIKNMEVREGLESSVEIMLFSSSSSSLYFSI